jgi:phosphoenolpyruvate-protein phosphotransferase (PTS system enzyme I)
MPSGVEPSRCELTGISASPGFAIGTLWIEDARPPSAYMPKKTSKLEAQALESAVNAAFDEIAELLADSSGHAASILEFQLAVLADNTFQDAALTHINQGQDTFQAWNSVLETEIAEYEAAYDETFRARALDLQDIQSRVSRILCDHARAPIPLGVIVLADNLTPTAFITHDWQGGGIALTKSSTASHVAILARQFSVPMVVNLKQSHALLKAGDKVLLDSRNQVGRLIVSPTSADKAAILPKVMRETSLKSAGLPLATRDGTPVSLMINLAHLRELDHLDASTVDGIGLVRTEFLFAEQNQRGKHLNEETQFQAYCEILNWAKGKPVYIRTFDYGGDKPVSGFAGNPAVSKLRGIRLSLSRPNGFRVQIRALLRAATSGNLHVTLPMVATQGDLNDTLALFKDEADKLDHANIGYAIPPIGIMVEVPAVAMTLELFAKAAHFSVGTNDLIQYTLSQPRDSAGPLPDIENSAVMALIKNIVAVGQALRKPVSVCGDGASKPETVPQLLNAGITVFSISPPSRPSVVNAIRTFSTSGEL